jgi:hypothetical protein
MSNARPRANLDLHIHRTDAGYRASVLRSPGGEGDADITVPVRRVDLAQQLADDAPPGIRDVIAGRGGLLRPTAMAEFGRRLFDAVFVGTVGLAYRRSLALGQAQGDGLRIRLRLAGVPELLDLPWELLYDRVRDGFVAASSETPLVRYLDLPQPVEPLAVDGPIRMLVVISNPNDRGDIDAPGEWGWLSGALDPLVASGRVAIQRLETATLASLTAVVAGGGFHVLHVVGHGGFDPSTQQGVVLLEADDGSSAPVLAEDLAGALAVAGGPRLIVLHTCEGARGSVVDPFAGTAQSLVGRGTAAVVAMQFEVTHEAARGFAHGFYTAVADGRPVDDAVTEGRVSMMTEGDGAEWATPVLYAHAADLQIFSVSATGATPLPAAPTDGRVVAGRLDVRIDREHGVRLDPSALDVIPRPRPLPVAVLPPPFPMLLGREAELVAAAGVDPGEMLVFAAGSGFGKTAVLRALANRQVGAAPGGLLFLRVRSRRMSDVLQFVFEGIFETDVAFKPTADQLRTWLSNADVAVVLDDTDFDVDELDALSEILPRGRLVVAAAEASSVGGLNVRALGGLAAASGVRLIELELGRTLTGDERRHAERLCAALEGNPARILQEAGRVADAGGSLRAVAEDLGGGAAVLTPDPAWIVDRPEPEQRTLGVLAAMDPAPVHVSHLVAVADLADPMPVLESLERRGLVRSASPLYNLAFPVSDVIADVVQADRRAAAVIDHLGGWAARASPDEVLRDTDLVLEAMRRGYASGRNAEVARLGRAVEGPLIAGRRWGQWGQVASLELSAAVDAADVAHQGWALHQLGSRALGLDDLKTAREHLSRALEIRESIGDTTGAQITRHNLDLAGGPPPDGWWRRWRRRLLGGSAVIAVVGLIGLVLWLALRDDDVPVEEDPVRSVDPTVLEFGEVTQGTSAELGLTVSNAGGGTLTVTRVVLPRDETAFVVADDCDAPLQAGETCSISVTFAPDEVGQFVSGLRIADDTGAAVERVRLVGVGVAEPVATVSFDPTTLEFSEQTLAAPATMSIAVISTGDAPLAIDGVEVQGDPAFDLSQEDCSGRSFPTDERCTVDIVFTPTARGPTSGELLVTDNAGEGRQIVTLTGIGITDQADLTVVDFRTEPAIDRGSAVEVPVVLTVRNDGDVPAGIFKISVTYTGGNPSPSSSLVPFVADDTEDVDPGNGFYPFTRHDLEPNALVTFTGVLRFSNDEEGFTVIATALADSCLGDEDFPEPPCRVDELDELNNTFDTTIEIPDFVDVE